MADHPALTILLAAAGIYMMHLWRADYLSFRSGQPNPQALPGATPCSLKACLISCAGALAILMIETLGEIHLGLTEQQSKITALFAGYTLIAAFIEELIFRGFIMVDSKRKITRWMGVFAASVLFAILHPFLWQWDMADVPAWQIIFIWRWDEWFLLKLTMKGWFSTAAVFISSLWFYAMRLTSLNPQRSLLPSISAHAIKNLGVIGIKAAQGYIVGWY
jgi:uncharacterized protein